MVSFEEFLKVIYVGFASDKNHWPLPESFIDPKTHLNKVTPRSNYENGLTFSVTWSLGGTQGSWATDEPIVVEPDQEPEFTDLDAILEMVVPNVSYIQYKSICNQVVKRDSRHHSDYYGGCTTEAFKGFDIKDLYDALVARKLI